MKYFWSVRGRTNFWKYSKTFITICAIMSVMIAGLASGEDGSVMLLFNSIRDSAGGYVGSFEEKDESGLAQATSTLLGSKSSKGFSKAGEINLSLIDRIPDVNSGKAGYVKELLCIYRDAQKGDLISGKGPKIPITTWLGMHYNETASREGLPNYYFLPSKWKKNTLGYCFMDYTSAASNRDGAGPDGSGGRGPFQYIYGDPCALNKNRSPLSLKRVPSNGDIRFLPDAMQTAYGNMNDFINQFNSGVLSDDVFGAFVGVANNRGGYGAYRYLGGTASFSDGSRVNSKASKQVIEQTAQCWVDLINNYFNEHPECKVENVINFDTEKSRFAIVAIAAHSSDWFIDSVTFSYCTGRMNVLIEVWKALYPKESTSSIKGTLEKCRADSIAESIKKVTGDSSVTGDDCAKVYGQSSYSSDSYRSRSGSGNGSVWHVSKKTDSSNFYKNSYSGGKRPYYITSFDTTASGYIFNCSPAFGALLYAKMLKIAGVDGVDPSNSASYTNSTQRQQTIVSNTFGTAIDSAYKSCGIKEKDLSDDRKVILNIAADIAKNNNYIYNMTIDAGQAGFYGWGRNAHRMEGFRLDCASFCEFVYYCAGFKDVKRETTSTLITSSDWETIPLSEAKPGDILIHRNERGGHVVVYLSGKDWNNLCTVEAKGENGIERDEQISIQIGRHLAGQGYIARRYKKIDKNKKDKPHQYPTKKSEMGLWPMTIKG